MRMIATQYLCSVQDHQSPLLCNNNNSLNPNNKKIPLTCHKEYRMKIIIQMSSLNKQDLQNLWNKLINKLAQQSTILLCRRRVYSNLIQNACHAQVNQQVDYSTALKQLVQATLLQTLFLEVIFLFLLIMPCFA